MDGRRSSLPGAALGGRRSSTGSSQDLLAKFSKESGSSSQPGNNGPGTGLQRRGSLGSNTALNSSGGMSSNNGSKITGGRRASASGGFLAGSKELLNSQYNGFGGGASSKEEAGLLQQERDGGKIGGHRRNSIPSADAFFAAGGYGPEGPQQSPVPINNSPVGAAVQNKRGSLTSQSLGVGINPMLLGSGGSPTAGDHDFQSQKRGSLLLAGSGSKQATGSKQVQIQGGGDDSPDRKGSSKTKTTMRSALLGNHLDATTDAKIVEYTSAISLVESQDKYGMYWRSNHMDRGEHITYDFGFPVHLTEVNVILIGQPNGPQQEGGPPSPSHNPKCIRVCYCNDDKLDSNATGMSQNLWLPSKRAYVAADAECLQIAWRCEEPARFWRLEMQLSWGPETGARWWALQDLQMITEESNTRGRTQGLKSIDVNQSKNLGRMTQEFDISRNLSPTQRAVRKLAKVVGVSVDEAENLKQKFDNFDADGSGCIDKEEFIQVLKAFTGTKAEISGERFDMYWRDVDSDGSGEVDFEEFLGWYKTVVRTGGLSPENFYATFGVQRLGLMNERIQEASKEKAKAAASGSKDK